MNVNSLSFFDLVPSHQYIKEQRTRAVSESSSRLFFEVRLPADVLASLPSYTSHSTIELCLVNCVVGKAVLNVVKGGMIEVCAPAPAY